LVDDKVGALDLAALWQKKVSVVSVVILPLLVL
jgi:hypothetical protein